ncbi:uncharacterized protein LOC144173221 [Haemaphysalis longicornis]
MAHISLLLLIGLALSVHQLPLGHALRVPGQARPMHPVRTDPPGGTAFTTVTTTVTSGQDHGGTNTASSGGQVLPSAVLTPDPRLRKEAPLTPSTPGTTNTWTAVTFDTTDTSTGGSTYTDAPSSVPEVISVKSGYALPTQPLTTIPSAHTSTQPDALFELTPRAQNAASADDLCRLLAARCERRFRRRLCRLFEECLENGTRRSECLQALTSVISSDGRCSRS